MKIFSKDFKVFVGNENKHARSLSLTPKLIDTHIIHDKTTGKRLGMQYTFEFYCIIDQREIYKGEISKIRAFISNVPVASLGNKTSIFSGVDIRDRKAVNNRLFDMVNIKENAVASSMDTLQFFTEFEPYQYFNQNESKFSKLSTIPDQKAFGTRKKYILVNKRMNNRSRRSGATKPTKTSSIFSNNRRTSTIVNTKEKELLEFEKNGAAFKRKYNAMIKAGIDPACVFQEKDRGQSAKQLLSGRAKIDKCINTNHVLRRYVKNNAKNQLKDDSDLDFEIKKITSSKRIARLKTKVRLTRAKLNKIINSNFHIVLFAYDKSGRRVDSFSYPVKFEQLIKPPPPVRKFNVESTRNNIGKVITKVQNIEKDIAGDFNLYYRKNNNYFGLKQNSFSKLVNSQIIGPKQTIAVRDGSTSPSSEFFPAFGTTTSVFQRCTFNYLGEEVGNTRCASVSSKTNAKLEPNAAIYCKLKTDAIQIFVTQVDEGIKYINVVKRIVKGVRGNDYIPIVDIKTGNKSTKARVTADKEGGNKKYKFVDIDVHPGFTYEYAIMAYMDNGSHKILPNTYIEKFTIPDELVSLTADISVSSDVSDYEDTISSAISKLVAGKIIINKTESELDRIVNSVFGNFGELFKKEFEDLKSASALLYGVKIERINTFTGDCEFVGDFRSRSSSATTDADKQENIEVPFVDNIEPFASYIYKINPYVIPASQVFEKVDIKIKKLVSQGAVKRKSAPINKVQAKRSTSRKNAFVSKRTGATSRVRNRAIASHDSIVEINSGDVFGEGLTGDILYYPISSQKLGSIFSNTSIVSSGRVKKLNIYDPAAIEDTKTDTKILNEIMITVNGSDSLVDFYIILKRENKTKNIRIDGVMHSTDDLSERKVYRYHSTCKGVVGMIEYYMLPVSKGGDLGEIVPVGVYTKEDE